MYGPPNYANPQGYFLPGMNQPQEHSGQRMAGPMPGSVSHGAYMYNQGGPQHFGQTFVSIPPNQPPPRMPNPNGYSASGNGPVGGYNQSVTSQGSSNGSADGNSPTNASIQGNQPAPHPAGPPPTQLPPNQVPQFQQIPVVNPRFFNPQNPPHMQPPPIQPFMVPPPPVLPPGYGQQHIAIPGGQQASTTQAGGGGPPPMIRHVMYTHQIQPQQPQFVNAQIPLHPQQMIPPPVLAARPGMPQQITTRGFMPPPYRNVMMPQQSGHRQIIYMQTPTNFMPAHQQMQGYIQQNASQFPPNYYRPDSRRSSTSYSRTQSESKFSDAKNEPTGSPDQNQNQQQQQQLQNLPPSHTPQFYHMPDGYIYQSPASSVATYDTATAAGSGYQSPEVMMGFPHQFYVGGPPVSEGYQQQQQFQQSGDGEGRKQQQYSSYEDRKQPYEEPTQPENEAQPPSESKISENYITAHTEQNQQHIEYEARNAMNNLNLNENANGATYENYSQNEENETPLNEQENANFDENAGQDVPQNWRKTLDQIQEENLPNDMGASTYAEKRIECSYCRTSGESESVYSSHSLLSPDGKIICSKLQEIGCSICHATGDDVHFERTCPQNEIPTASYLQSLAQQIFTHRGHQHSYKPNGYSPRGSRGGSSSFRGNRDREGGGSHQKSYNKNYGGGYSQDSSKNYGRGGYSQDSGKNYGGGIRKTSQGSYDGNRQGGRRNENESGRGGRYDDGNRRRGSSGNYKSPRSGQ